MRCLRVFLAIVLSTSTLMGQLPKGMGFEYSVHIGRAFKHRSTITIDFPDWSFGSELNIEFKTYGKKDWHERCGFPHWGVALSYLYTGNAQQMGHGLAIVPNVTVDFLKGKNWRLFGRLGIGLGVITQPFHRMHNPLNNMVGSHLNNSTSLRLGFSWRIHKHWELRPSATFTHFSNAASTLPNLGINIPTFQLGLCYWYNPVEKEDYIRESTKFTRPKRVQWSAVATMGFRAAQTNNGPLYPVWHVSVDAGLFILKNNRLKAGMEYDYIGSVYAFSQNNGGYSGLDLHWQASRITFYIADEIFIGRFAILAQVGIYATQNLGQPWWMSIRLSGRYYLLDPFKHQTVPFLTATMKSHKIVAEYFSLGLGLSF